MSFQIVAYVMLYLLVGAVIAGIGDISAEKEIGNYTVTLLFWPILIAFIVLMVVSQVVNMLSRAVQGKLNE
jgi:ABC-type Na+ efflux pump permease subunit